MRPPKVEIVSSHPEVTREASRLSKTLARCILKETTDSNVILNAVAGLMINIAHSVPPESRLEILRFLTEEFGLVAVSLAEEKFDA